MSVEMWPDPNNPEIEYPIGTVGWKGPREGFWRILDYNSDMIVPTYGYWAGPGWCGGERPDPGSEIKWELPPCYNNNIKTAGADPNNCYSLLDAITKTHDWNYSQAEKSGDPAVEK